MASSHIYCSKCGTQNEYDSSHCSNCGEPLKGAFQRSRDWEEELEMRAEEFGERAEQFGKRMEDECFGLPGGNNIFGIIFGLVIILVGVSQLLDWNIDFGPFIIIIIGVLVVAGALYRQSQHRRY